MFVYSMFCILRYYFIRVIAFLNYLSEVCSGDVVDVVPICVCVIFVGCVCVCFKVKVKVKGIGIDKV